MTTLRELNNVGTADCENGDVPANGDFFRAPLHVNKIPNRNDLCPCGSGKKFKKCCIGIITKEYTE